MKIKLKDLRFNPFYGLNIHRIERKKIEELKNSIRTTGFWNNLIVRRSFEDVGRPFKLEVYEIAYGHHRLIALRELIQEQLLDEDFEIECPLCCLDDASMVRIMAASNRPAYGFQDKAYTIQDVLRFVSIECKVEEKDINASDISAFLGSGWTEKEVKTALNLIRKGAKNEKTGQGVSFCDL